MVDELDILLLGGSGFVGSALSESLIKLSGVNLRIASRTPVTCGKVSSRIKYYCLDICDLPELHEAAVGVKVIINCTTGNAREIVIGAKNIFAVAEANSARVIHFSSMAVYGSATGLVDESSSGSCDLKGYGLAKKQSEEILSKCGQCVILRPGIIYGKGGVQWSIRISKLLLSGRLGDLGAAGDGICNLVHVLDVADAVKSIILRSTSSGVYNLATKSPPTWNQYFISFAKELGVYPIKRITNRALAIESRFYAYLIKFLQLLCRAVGLRVVLPELISPQQVRLFSQRIKLDCSKAERELDFRARCFADVIKDISTAYQD
ncbi:MAG: NAD-dependent epimerase/dehydratase family protein [Spongiibacter marinus]|uniref:NAD-dependent epimerase/dehydratase family protein n=1 Tax=Spongiibacter marinus TaxID=354246 RepID=UPI003C3E463B